MQWRARLRGKNVKTYLVFPYNPYFPEPYSHFAKGNYLERGEEFLIGKEYWDLLGGNGTYQYLKKVMREIGKSLLEPIEKKIDQIMKGIYLEKKEKIKENPGHKQSLDDFF